MNTSEMTEEMVAVYGPGIEIEEEFIEEFYEFSY